MGDKHVVFGTGPVGLALVDELHRAGKQVRAVNKTGRADVPDGVEVTAGDASDRGFASEAATGAAVLYQCLQPAYHRWAELFPPLQDTIVAAARETDARLVSFENTYLYGDTHGEPMTEETPARPHTRKGRVRLEMANQLAELHRAGALDVATARGSDYYGPRGTTQSPLGDLVIGAALAGKPARVVGDPDQPHSYTYTVDAGRTLAALGERDDISGEVFHVPNAPARTTREIIGLISEEIGAPIRVSAAPRLILKGMGLFNPTVRELDEMLYEFTQPFIVDGSKAERRLGIQPTPIEDAVAVTVGRFRDRESG